MQSIIFFIVGIILFIYGVFYLTEKLKLLLKDKIVIYLRRITNNPYYSTLFGVILTALNQSSTATSVLAVALVSSGLLTFYNSLGIIFGANIGTAIVINFVAIGFTKIAFLFILLGFILFFKKETRNIGTVIFYIGIAFFGLYLISIALEPLKNNALFLEFIKEYSNSYLLLFIAILLTIITNSSAITISSAIILSQHGILTLFPMMLIVVGANIGTTFTTILASFTGSLNAKRAAFAHLFFNIGGAILFLPFLTQIQKLLVLINIPVANQAAIFHLVFNIITAIIFLLLINQFSSLILKILPGKEETIAFSPAHLNKILIKNPEIALEAVRKELVKQSLLTQQMLKKSFYLMHEFNKKVFDEVEFIEAAVDNLQGEILSFLDNIILEHPPLSKRHLQTIIYYSLLTNEIERIADRALNIAQIARYKSIYNENLSNEIMLSINALSEEILLLNSESAGLLKGDIIKPKHELTAKNRIKELKLLFQNMLFSKRENLLSAITMTDFIVNCERIVIKCATIRDLISKAKSRKFAI